jgi:hypothetical protein
MGLTGNLRTMALGDIVQWIAMGTKTGTLHVMSDAIEKRISFLSGRIVNSWSNDPRESLGQFLLRDGLVDEEHIFKGLLAQEKDDRGRKFGQILVDGGVLTEDVLKAVLKTKAKEAVYELFLWEEGEFEFREGEASGEAFAILDMAPTGVLLEGVRRVDEWTRIRKFFPTNGVRFAVAPNAVPEDDAEKNVLNLITRRCTLGELSLELRRSEFDTAALLFDMYSRGLVSIVSTGEQTRASSTLEMIRDRLSLADARLAQGDSEAALKAYEDVLAIDRLNQQAKKGVIAAIEARTSRRRIAAVDVSRVPHLTMELHKLTGLKFDPQEGFVLSRINGEWDVASILKLCPMAEEDALAIFARLIERGVIELTT